MRRKHSNWFTGLKHNKPPAGGVVPQAHIYNLYVTGSVMGTSVFAGIFSQGHSDDGMTPEEYAREELKMIMAEWPRMQWEMFS